jgi:hypothetical protein
MTPTTITLPGIVGYLERFLRPLSATSGDGIEIRQDERRTVVAAIEGRHAAIITTPIPGSLEPVLVDPASLAGVDPSRPARIYRLAETSGVVELATGELSTITITPGTLSAPSRDLADVVGGEIASGMTKAVFEVDPRHLLAVAEALVATGAEKATIAVAPRWNVLACMAETPDVIATFTIAGETFDAPDPTSTAAAEDDPLSFTIGERKPTATRATPSRNARASAGIDERDLPW